MVDKIAFSTTVMNLHYVAQDFDRCKVRSKKDLSRLFLRCEKQKNNTFSLKIERGGFFQWIRRLFKPREYRLQRGSQAVKVLTQMRKHLLNKTDKDLKTATDDLFIASKGKLKVNPENIKRCINQMDAILNGVEQKKAAKAKKEAHKVKAFFETITLPQFSKAPEKTPKSFRESVDVMTSHLEQMKSRVEATKEKTRCQFRYDAVGYQNYLDQYSAIFELITLHRNAIQQIVSMQKTIAANPNHPENDLSIYLENELYSQKVHLASEIPYSFLPILGLLELQTKETASILLNHIKDIIIGNSSDPSSAYIAALGNALEFHERTQKSASQIEQMLDDVLDLDPNFKNEISPELRKKLQSAQIELDTRIKEAKENLHTLKIFLSLAQHSSPVYLECQALAKRTVDLNWDFGKLHSESGKWGVFNINSTSCAGLLQYIPRVKNTIATLTAQYEAKQGLFQRATQIAQAFQNAEEPACCLGIQRWAKSFLLTSADGMRRFRANQIKQFYEVMLHLSTLVGNLNTLIDDFEIPLHNSQDNRPRNWELVRKAMEEVNIPVILQEVEAKSYEPFIPYMDANTATSFSTLFRVLKEKCERVNANYSKFSQLLDKIAALIEAYNKLRLELNAKQAQIGKNEKDLAAVWKHLMDCHSQSKELVNKCDTSVLPFTAKNCSALEWTENHCATQVRESFDLLNTTIEHFIEVAKTDTGSLIRIESGKESQYQAFLLHLQESMTKLTLTISTIEKGLAANLHILSDSVGILPSYTSHANTLLGQLKQQLETMRPLWQEKNQAAQPQPQNT